MTTMTSRKKEVINACLSNPNLTVVNALDLLRSKNLNSSPSKQKLPLTYEQVKKIIQDFRENNNINSTLSISDPSLMKTIDGALFRRCYNTYDVIYKNKFIINSYVIYCSPFQQTLLRNASHWYVDSTFHVVPDDFYQLLVIVVYDDVTDSYMPCCYCLASRKNQHIYYKIFRDIKEILEDNHDLESITLDFEQSQIDGAGKVFPNLKFIGCKFHFMQALLRKAQKKGLMNENVGRETNDIIHGIRGTLEKNSVCIKSYLDSLDIEYTRKADDPKILQKRKYL